MTEKEYRDRDYALICKIEDYQADNAEHELQIALNNKQIVSLEHTRHELFEEYKNQKPRQVNLQGQEF